VLTMIPLGLTNVLANRKKFIDENSDTYEGQGQGNGTIDLRSTSHGLNFHEKSLTGYTGLINQGATCYLNSLLQSLYMIPEFRSALYSSQFTSSTEQDEGTESRQGQGQGQQQPYQNFMPYQLQKLFLQLQYSLKSSISTSSLTQSFGWTSSDSFTQQDVQECMTVIFEYLCHLSPQSEIALFLQNEWFGELQCGLRCQNCQQVRWRNETFHDLQVQVRGMASIEESLLNYFDEEVMDGVDCEQCQGRHQHLKTGKFTKLPYILSLQLRRFDMNWVTMQRFFPSSFLLYV
jgi:ubiquitin carboxyl-terminal hydrolase 47